MTTTGELLQSTGGLLIILSLLVVALLFRYFSYRTELQLINTGTREEAVGGRQALFTAGMIMLAAGSGMVFEVILTIHFDDIPSGLFGLPIALSGVAAIITSWYIKWQGN